MKTTLDTLKALSSYPIPINVIESIAEGRKLTLDKSADITSMEYQLTVADIRMWLSTAPNVSQEGISYDTLVSDRNVLRELANNTYRALGDSSYQPDVVKPKYGYKGSKL